MHKLLIAFTLCLITLGSAHAADKYECTEAWRSVPESKDWVKKSCQSLSKYHFLNPFFTVEQNKLYYYESESTQYSECASFFPCNGAGPHRRHVVEIRQFTLVQGDPDIKQWVALSVNTPYATDFRALYYKAQPVSGFKVPEGLSKDMVKVLADDRYVQIGASLLRDGILMADVNVNAFTLMTNIPNRFDLSKDDQRVFWNGIAIAEADPESFEVVADSFLLKDKRHVWRVDIDEPKLLNNADPHLVSVGGNYYKTGKKVLYRTHFIPEADAASFEAIDLACQTSSGVCGDQGSPLCEVAGHPNLRCGQDSAAARPFNVARDKQHVYVDGEVINEIDAKSFLPLLWKNHHLFGLDAHHYFDYSDARVPSLKAYAYDGQTYGPVMLSSSGSGVIFANAKGLINVLNDGKGLQTCANLDPADSRRTSYGPLHIAKVSNAAWAFQDEKYTYVFTQNRFSTSSGFAEFDPNVDDYLIEKGSGKHLVLSVHQALKATRDQYCAPFSSPIKRSKASADVHP